MALTDLKCKTAKPQDKAYKLADGQGLYLYVSSSGGKSWRYNYRIHGKFKTYTYGLYPEISLQEARDDHAIIHKMVSKGVDPFAEKRKADIDREKHENNSFQAVTQEWLAKRKKEVKEKSYHDCVKRIERDVLPEIGHLPIIEVTPPILIAMIRKIEARGAYEMANRARQYCSQVFRYAIAIGKADRDYTLDISSALTKPRVRHQPAFEPNDIPRFLQALERNEPRLFMQTRLALEMLLLTFVRPIELASAQWSEFDFVDKRWIVPAEKTKMRKDHVVPLTHQTIAILKQLQQVTGNRQHVFVNQRDPSTHMSRDSLSKAVRALGFQGEHTAHGFRALALTALQEKLGYPFAVADCQLGHGKKNALGAAYDRAQFLDERTVMMQKWADYIDMQRGY